MAQVESIKCPNCGGTVRGTGAVTCPYCGSALEVTPTDRDQLRAVKREFGTAGVDVGVKPPYFFKNLPGVEIKRETKDIPFQPEVLFARLKGGEPTGTLRGEADAILDVARRTQEAINREDMELYMSCITAAGKKFRAKAQRGANTQFVQTDMKRYTVSADFRMLSAEKAEVTVSIEAFIWLSSGQVNHMQVPFGWRLRKEEGRWVVYASGIGGTVRGTKWGACIIPIVGAAVGIVAAIIAVVSECREEHQRKEEYAKTEEGSAAWEARSRRKPMPETWFKTRTNMRLYETPREDADLEAVVKAGAEFQVMSESQGWYHVSTRDRTWGWVPEKELKRQLGKDFGQVKR